MTKIERDLDWSKPTAEEQTLLDRGFKVKKQDPSGGTLVIFPDVYRPEDIAETKKLHQIIIKHFEESGFDTVILKAAMHDVITDQESKLVTD